MENKDHKIQKIHKIAFIYCIKSYQTDKVYIGSTAQRLSKRLSQHKCNYKNYLNDKYGYMSSFEIVKYDDCYIEMIETLNDVNKMEMEKIEGVYIKNTDCVNKLIAGRTYKEYREDNKKRILERAKKYYNINKDKISEKSKKYYQDNKEQKKEHSNQYYNDNKEQIKEQAKQYRENNKDKIKEFNKEYRQNNKEKISEYKKEYRQDNKEKISEQQKQYYQDNKEKISEKIKEYYNINEQKIKEQRNQKHKCLCGGKYTTAHKSKHEKTKMHINYIQNIK